MVYLEIKFRKIRKLLIFNNLSKSESALIFRNGWSIIYISCR